MQKVHSVLFSGGSKLPCAGWGQLWRGEGRRAATGRCWAGPQSPSHCTSLFTAMTQVSIIKGGTCPQMPDWQGTAALSGRVCKMALCPIERKQKSTAMEVTWQSLSPHKFYFLLHFIFPGPIHITTCSYKLGATNKQSAGQNLAHCAYSNLSIPTAVPSAYPCDASQDQPDPLSPTRVGESHGCHVTAVTVIPNKGTCCKLPSSCLVLTGLR